MKAETIDLETGEIAPVDVSVVERQHRAEINQMIATAKQYPRTIERCIAEARGIIERDKEIALACRYAKPVAGKKMVGPSVRLAEILVYSWGNIRAGARMIEDHGDFVTCQATCVDLEKNVGVQIEVQRRAVDKNGNRYATHVLENTVNAGNAIAFRNAVFKIIPASIVKELEGVSVDVAAGKAEELPGKRKAAIEYFKGKGVDKAALLRHLARREESMITREDVIYLGGLKNAIEGGEFDAAEMRKLDQYGEPIGGVTADEPKGEGAAAGLKEAADKARERDEAEPTAEEPGDDESEAQRRELEAEAAAEEARLAKEHEEQSGGGKPSTLF